MDFEYVVPDEMKKLWAVELSLFEKLKEICEKWNLTYYASDGTLLGAVRHKGFIPWDDDMDFYLKWPDYQKLMEVAPRECQYPFFFQSIYTEQNAIANGCRLRRSDTTGYTKWEQENTGPDYNRGIFIDIFPLFFVPDTADEREKQKETIMHLWRCIRGHDALIQLKRGKPVNKQYESYISEYLSLCEQKEIPEAESLDIVWLKEEYLNACAWNLKESALVGMTSFRCHSPNLMWDSEWFERSVDLPFEDTTINCPAEYEKILEREFGDWRTPVRGGADHELFMVDTETPWDQIRADN